MFKHFNKPRPIPLIMSVTGVVLMFGMSIWQVQRLAWKEDLVAKIERAMEQKPLTSLPAPEELDEYRFYPVELTGSFMPQYEFHIAARYYHSQLGYHVYTPFQTIGGKLILINRGWIPSKQKDGDYKSTLPTDMVTLTAQLRTSNERNPFTPENQPEKNVWFGRDAQQMCETIDLQCEPFTLDLIGEQSWDSMPIPSSGEIKLRNDHLGYAITWFAIGLGILIISLLYHRKTPDKTS